MIFRFKLRKINSNNPKKRESHSGIDLEIGARIKRNVAVLPREMLFRANFSTDNFDHTSGVGKVSIEVQKSVISRVLKHAEMYQAKASSQVMVIQLNFDLHFRAETIFFAVFFRETIEMT